MSKNLQRQQLDKRTDNKKLLQQFYSKLNLNWQQRPECGNKNPVLYKIQGSLISKSLAHKFFNSKKYKLKNTNQSKKKQSSHVFTTNGITNANIHRRRMSDPNSQNFLVKRPMKSQYQDQTQQNKKYITKYIKCSSMDLQESIKLSQNEKKIQRVRAVSAYPNHRRYKNTQNQLFSCRKSSLYTEPKNKIEEQQRFSGWETFQQGKQQNICHRFYTVI